MTGIDSRARKLSLSVAGVLALVLLVGPAFVPRELRADAASRVKSLAGDLDAALIDAWQLAFRTRESDHPAETSGNHENSPLHSGAQLVSARGEMLSSASSDESSIGMNGFGADSFNTVHSGGSSPDSMAALLSDILKDHNSGFGVHAGLEALTGSYTGTGNALDHFGGAGNYSASAGTSGAIAPAGVSRLGPTLSHAQNTEGMLSPAGVNPSAHDAYTDAHQGRVGQLESGFGSSSDIVSSGSGNQVESSDVASAELPGYAPPMVGAIHDGSGVSHDRGNVDPTAIEPTTQPLSGLDQPLQGEDPHDFGVQNGGDDRSSSGSGDGPAPNFSDSPGDGSHPEGHGSIDQPAHRPDPDPGFLANVPEPGSLTLLSLALGTVILWRRFRSVH